jgi:hypothetical protein
MVFDGTGMLCVPAAASKPAHHSVLARICRNRLPNRTMVRLR